jgi:transposase
MAEWEKPKPVKSLKLAGTPSISGFRKGKKLEIIERLLDINAVMVRKLPTWKSLRSLLENMAVRLKGRWQKLGKGKLVTELLAKPWRKLDLLEKKTYGYQERDETKRQEFLAKISQKSLEERVYIDESGIDNRDDYGYGWNEKGQRFYALKSGKRSIRVSIISALCQGKLIAPFTFEGSCNRLVFEQWLSEKLLPMLRPGQTVILDNATFHKSEKIRELITSAKCELEYLPPYSPDLNEIEHYWFPIKNRVRKSQGSIENFRERVDTSVRLSS